MDERDRRMFEQIQRRAAQMAGRNFGRQLQGFPGLLGSLGHADVEPSPEEVFIEEPRDPQVDAGRMEDAACQEARAALLALIQSFNRCSPPISRITFNVITWRGLLLHLWQKNLIDKADPYKAVGGSILGFLVVANEQPLENEIIVDDEELAVQTIVVPHLERFAAFFRNHARGLQ